MMQPGMRIRNRCKCMAETLKRMVQWDQPHWSGRPKEPQRRPPIRPNGFALIARACARYSMAVMAGYLVLAIIAIGFALATLSVDPDSLPQVTLDDRTAAAQAALQKNFPGIDSAVLAVVSGENRDAGREGALELATALGGRPDLFATAFVPGTGAFYSRYGLLYPAEEIAARVSDLIQKQPLYLAVSAAPDLQGLAALISEIGRAVEQGRSPPGLAGLLMATSGVIEAEVAGESRALNWTELAGLTPGNGSSTWFVVATPVAGMDNEAAAFARSLTASATGVTWLFPRATQGEPRQIIRNFAVPVGLAIVVTLTVLLAGIGRLRLAIPLVLNAIVTVALAAAIAAILNARLDGVTWSFAAAVVAPALLLSSILVLAHIQARLRGAGVRQSIMLASQRRGGMQCAVAMIFAVFWLSWLVRQIPSLTEFAVVALFGTGVALAAALTLVPAALAAFDQDDDELPLHWFDVAVAMPIGSRERNALQFGAMILLAAGVFCAVFLPSTKFGERLSGFVPPPQLQTPDARGAIHVLTKPGDPAREMVATLSSLPEVGAIRWAELLLPPDLDQKIATLAQLEGHLPSAPQPRADGVAQELAMTFAQLEGGLQQIADGPSTDETLRKAAHRLRRAISLLTNPQLPSPARVEAIEASLFSGMEPMARTAAALTQLKKPTLEDLDPALRRRFVSPEGEWRIEVMPKEGVGSLSFAAALRKVAPDASGEPVLALSRNEIMHHETVLAFAAALTGAVILAFAALRDLWRWLLVLPVMALFFTYAAAALAVMNMALSAAMLAALSCAAAVTSATAVLMAERARLSGPENVDPRDTSFRTALLPLLVLAGAVAPLALSANPPVSDYGLSATLFLVIATALCMILIPSLGQWVRQFLSR
jgi:uncharacterized protein